MINVTELINTYKETNSLNKTAKIHSLTLSKVYRILKPLGIVKKQQRGNCNHLIFNNIDTEEKAYWLGFLTADGNVYVCDKKWRTKHVISLTLAIIDLEHIKKFREFIGSTNKIRIAKQKSGYKIGAEFCSIAISSKEMIEDLAKYNIVPRKTFKTDYPENLDPKFKKHYWRGVIDGDGFLTISNRPQFGIGLVGDLELLEDFERFVKVDFNTEAKIRKHSSIFQITIRGSEGLKLANFLYKDAKIFLERKQKKLEKVNEILLDKMRVKK